VVVRPSYVLGGVGDGSCLFGCGLERYMTYAVQVEPEHPILIDKFLENAIEVDVDAIADHTGRVVIGGIMEHIEQAGFTLATQLAPTDNLVTVGSFKQDSDLDGAAGEGAEGDWADEYSVCCWVPRVMTRRFIFWKPTRASRTVPFVSKATVPLAKLASLIMAGKTLESLGFTQNRHLLILRSRKRCCRFINFPVRTQFWGQRCALLVK